MFLKKEEAAVKRDEGIRGSSGGRRTSLQKNQLRQMDAVHGKIPDGAQVVMCASKFSIFESGSR